MSNTFCKAFHHVKIDGAPARHWKPLNLLVWPTISVNCSWLVLILCRIGEVCSDQLCSNSNHFRLRANHHWSRKLVLKLMSCTSHNMLTSLRIPSRKSDAIDVSRTSMLIRCRAWRFQEMTVGCYTFTLQSHGLHSKSQFISLTPLHTPTPLPFYYYTNLYNKAHPLFQVKLFLFRYDNNSCRNFLQQK